MVAIVVFGICAAVIIALIFSPEIAKKIKSAFSKEAKAVETDAKTEAKKLVKKL